MKDRSHIKKLKVELDSVMGKKHFDPSKAFQPRAKENDPAPQHDS